MSSGSSMTRADFHPSNVPAPSGEPCPMEVMEQVGQHLQKLAAREANCLADEPLTDQTREEAIRRAGSAMHAWYSRYEMSARKDAGALAQAVHCQQQMYALIRGRSAAQVARMEQERGLA